MAEDFEITGKKKLVVDESGYFNAKRKLGASDELDPSVGEEYFDGIYFDASSEVDKVRVAIGKNWDYRATNSSTIPIFSNDWSKFKAFAGYSFTLESCEDIAEAAIESAISVKKEELVKITLAEGTFKAPPIDHGKHYPTEKEAKEAGFNLGCGEIAHKFKGRWYPCPDPEVAYARYQSMHSQEYYDVEAEIEELGEKKASLLASLAGTGLILNQLVVLKVPIDLTKNPEANILEDRPHLDENFGAYVKTGLDGRPPLIKAGYWFHDHYHDTFMPFTPDELITKQPLGKAYFADYKTYYNERLDSAEFEQATGSRLWMQNSLPNIYGFLRLVKNDLLLENSNFELSELTFYLKDYFNTNQWTDETVYTTLFQKYPLETLITLYGSISMYNPDQEKVVLESGWPDSNQLIERIINFDYTKFDADALFEEYFNTHTQILDAHKGHMTDAGVLHGYFVPPAAKETLYVLNKLAALERIMSNIVFSPNFIPIMDKVDQYKKHFPYYVDLQFTAKRLTALGDLMKDLFLTRYFSYKVFAGQGVSEPGAALGTYGILDSWNLNKKFVEFSSEKIYTDISGKEAAASEHMLTGATTKKMLDLDSALTNLIAPDPVAPHLAFSPENVVSFQGDVRNYVTFVRDDFKDPVKLINDDNTVFRILSGTIFRLKILDLYKKHRRSYTDILNGIPAYTEDMFYRIEKMRKRKNDPDAKWEPVQSILIPNTSELDIARYVDTQLKYSTYATYKYNVYSIRVVFGSKYKYIWGDTVEADNGTLEFLEVSPQQPAESTSVNGEILILGDPDEWGPSGDPWTGIGNSYSEGEAFNLTAKFLVRVKPSIQMIEDKLFSTPEVLIMDRPPMPPDINIIPYRAVNNKLKFLLNGTTGRAKEKPILILNSDKEKFDLVKKAQLVVSSADSSPLEEQPIEFANDDPVKKFQIFRVRKKPTSYGEFELYRNNVTSIFEETISPNTKYYYTFRAIDDHDHVSNPSPVYEVELIDEKGAVKPIIRLVSIDPIEPKSYIKECQKYIYIKPSLKQLYFSENEEVDGIFSIQSKKKRYKLRLTSKGSGKKIDINFSYEKLIDLD